MNSKDPLQHFYPAIPAQVVTKTGSKAAVASATWTPEDGLRAEVIVPGEGLLFAFDRLIASAPTGRVMRDGQLCTIETVGGTDVTFRLARCAMLAGTPKDGETALTFSSLDARVTLSASNPAARWRALLRNVVLPTWPDARTVQSAMEMVQHRDTLIFPHTPAATAAFSLRRAIIEGLPDCAWVLCDDPLAEDSFRTLVFDLQQFLRLALCAQVDLLWTDRALPNGRLERTYHRANPLQESRGGPVVPLGRRDEVKIIPKLFRAYSAKCVELRLEEVADHLLRAQQVMIHDERRELSLALETLADALHTSTAAARPLPDAVWLDLNSRICNALSTVGPEHAPGLEVVRKRLKHLNDPTNAEKHRAVFAAARITLTPEEQRLLRSRNPALHGARMLAPDGEPDTLDRELAACRALRTLLNRAILGLLDHEGLYIDYAEAGARDTPMHRDPPR